MHGLALLSHYYKSSTCVCSVIFSVQRRCMGVLCCYFGPKMFSPGDHVRYHSRTLGAHVLATVVGPLPNGPQFCHIRYIRPGGVTPVDHESAQLSRLEAVAVESPKSPESPDITPMAPTPNTGTAHTTHYGHKCAPEAQLAVHIGCLLEAESHSLCLHQWRVPQFALKYLCNPPPPPTRDTVAR